VSGIGVRCALYLQALFALLLLCAKRSPREIIFANVSLQVTALSLLAGAYFSQQIDVAHTLMVSHFAMMLSACRASSDPVSMMWLKSRQRFPMLSTLLFLDMLFRPIVLAFNWSIWIVIRQLHWRRKYLCNAGAGYWVFIGEANTITDETVASSAAFCFVIIDIVWELTRLVAEGARWLKWNWNGENRSPLAAFDARVWWLRGMVGHGREQSGDLITDLLIFCDIFVYRIWTWIYVIITVERMIVVNNIAAEKGGWTFQLIFAFVNMLALFVVLCFQYWTWIGFSFLEAVFNQLVNHPVYILKTTSACLTAYVCYLILIAFLRSNVAAFLFGPWPLEWGTNKVILWMCGLLFAGVIFGIMIIGIVYLLSKAAFVVQAFCLENVLREGPVRELISHELREIREEVHAICNTLRKYCIDSLVSVAKRVR
jgi:hypothetical protein